MTRMRYITKQIKFIAVNLLCQMRSCWSLRSELYPFYAIPLISILYDQKGDFFVLIANEMSLGREEIPIRSLSFH